MRQPVVRIYVWPEGWLLIVWVTARSLSRRNLKIFGYSLLQVMPEGHWGWLFLFGISILIIPERRTGKMICRRFVSWSRLFKMKLRFSKDKGVPYEKHEGDRIFDRVAELIDQEKVIGLVQGRMEFGPRALGARSIIGDARSTKMQEEMNVRIKFRESFRPFAPSVLKEKAQDYFDLSCESPYMLLVAKVKENQIDQVHA